MTSMKARWIVAGALLLVFAAGVGVGLLLAEDDTIERVDASDVEALVWEGRRAPDSHRTAEPNRSQVSERGAAPSSLVLREAR